jgi:hypothetical protein
LPPPDTDTDAGAVLQPIERVLVTLVPAQMPLPFTVRVAVNNVAVFDGVNEYVAGFVPVPDHAPEPVPPLQAIEP